MVLSIPFMLLAITVAILPLAWTIRHHEELERHAPQIPDDADPEELAA